jgi:hypothetical protein
MKTLEDLQTEIKALLVTLSDSYASSLKEISTFMAQNNFTNINDIGDEFPNSVQIVELGRKLYRINLLLKSQSATLTTALNINLENSNKVDANLFEKLLSNTEVANDLAKQGERRAILAFEMNDAKDKKEREALEAQRDQILDTIQHLSKEQVLLCAHSEYSTMVSLLSDQLKTLPNLLTSLQTNIQEAEANQQRLSKAKESDWDKDFDENPAPLKSSTPPLEDPSASSDEEADWDTEFGFSEVEVPKPGLGSAAIEPQLSGLESPKGIKPKQPESDEEDLEDFALESRPSPVGFKRKIDATKEKEKTEEKADKAARAEPSDKKSPKTH